MITTNSRTHHLALPWNLEISSLLATTTELLGQDQFDHALIDLLQYCLAFDSCGVMEYFVDRPPRQRLHRFDASQRTVAKDAYVEGPYVLDPVYGLFLDGKDSGVYLLRELVPDDFEQSEYHQIFYSLTGVIDDVSLMVRRNDGNAVLIFLERSTLSPMFTPADLLTLELLWPVIKALVEQHEVRRRVRPASQDETHTHLQVSATLSDFGKSRLTEREREVLFFMITGHSSSLTAEKLRVAEGTVKNHRKAIHRKLDIGSQAELFSLFLSCIPYSQPGTGVDPLAVYESRPLARQRR